MSILSIALVAGGCPAPAQDRGACVVTVVAVPGTDLTDQTAYCADEKQCADYCQVARDVVNDCRYVEDSSCTSDLADAELPVVCALYRSIDCGDRGDAFEPYCDVACTAVPDTSEYEPSTGCLIKYAGPVAVAHSCADALGQI